MFLKFRSYVLIIILKIVLVRIKEWDYRRNLKVWVRIEMLGLGIVLFKFEYVFKLF